MVSWIEVLSKVNPLGTFTHQIKWVPPTTSGFIVQYVNVEDPFQLLSGYGQPYYEVWRVENGKITNDAPRPEEYDDSFSNCWDDEWPGTQIAIETAERQMERAGTDHSYVAYHCRVFWIQAGTDGAAEIENWKTGEEQGIRMAGKLKASYTAPADIGEGRVREFRADFLSQRRENPV